MGRVVCLVLRWCCSRKRKSGCLATFNYTNLGATRAPFGWVGFRSHRKVSYYDDAANALFRPSHTGHGAMPHDRARVQAQHPNRTFLFGRINGPTTYEKVRISKQRKGNKGKQEAQNLHLWEAAAKFNYLSKVHKTRLVVRIFGVYVLVKHSPLENQQSAKNHLLLLRVVKIMLY